MEENKSNQDFEMIKDSLPSEGNAIVIIRQNGKLKTANISLSINLANGSIDDDRALGELLHLNKMLTDISLGCGVLSIFIALAVAFVWYQYPESTIYVYGGAVVASVILYFFADGGYSDTRRKLFFNAEGISIISKVCTLLKISEPELLAKISRTDKLSEVEKYLSIYLNRSM